VKLLLPTAALLLAMACQTPIPDDGTVGCQVELATRARLVDETLVVEVWVTNFFEDRVILIPDCVGVSLTGVPIVYCGEDGLPDPSQCQPASFELRADTSVQVAQVELPLAGDACNEPPDPGPHDVVAFGVDAGQAEVCRLFAQAIIPE